jgi:hypothetical protein
MIELQWRILPSSLLGAKNRISFTRLVDLVAQSLPMHGQLRPDPPRFRALETRVRKASSPASAADNAAWRL